MNCDISGSNLLRILPSFDFFCGWIRYRISYVNSRALLADFEKVGDEGGRADHRLGIMSMVGNGELAYTPEGRSARSVLTQIRYFCGPRRQLGEFSWGGNYGVRVFSCQCMWRLVGVYLKKKKKNRYWWYGLNFYGHYYSHEGKSMNNVTKQTTVRDFKKMNKY